MSKRKTSVFGSVLGILLLLFLQNFVNDEEPPLSSQQRTAPSGQDQESSAEEEKPIRFTKHGLCRFQCRKITHEDLDRVLSEGWINKQKSKPNSKPCPVYAYEGQSDLGERLRVVMAECEKERKVITVINRERTFNCECE